MSGRVGEEDRSAVSVVGDSSDGVLQEPGSWKDFWWSGAQVGRS